MRPAILIADLAIATLAGMVPSDIKVTICDENATPVDFDCAADFIGITGKVTQRYGMIRIADEFRKRGKKVIIGGPYASLNLPDLRPHCDILVRGETEEIFSELCSDLKGSCWKTEYVGTRPDLSASALPRWDLYPNDRALSGGLQTARGCPFECEFCDTIQYVGRKQRHKPVPVILTELDALYGYGYRRIFLADDNFTAFRSRAREMLIAIRDWNNRREHGRVRFESQLSIDISKDEEMLRLCSEAGLTYVFIGIETPNSDSLQEAQKRQNLGMDLTTQVRRFIEYGIGVSAGMIVGFDHDGPDIFERQYRFAMAVPVPIFSLGCLVATHATPLRARIEKEGRLLPNDAESSGLPWDTNIIPKNMTREQLLNGIRWLANTLYAPEAFVSRVLDLIEIFGTKMPSVPSREERKNRTFRSVEQDALLMLSTFPKLGAQEAALWPKIVAALERRPQARTMALTAVLQYIQVRYMYQYSKFWDPQINLVSPR